MYAFNKRFRPTLWLGMTITSIACLLLAILLLFFALGSWLQLKNPALGFVLFLAGAGCVAMAIRDHKNKDKTRIIISILTGRTDKKARPMELING